MTMFIHELARTTGVSAKAIRYYESIGLMPDPERADNNYRQYAPDAIERLRFIVSARSLGFNLTDIGEFLSARDEGTLPCQRILDSFDRRIADIDRRIADLLALRGTLTQIRSLGKDLPADKKCDAGCANGLITQVYEHGLTSIPIERVIPLSLQEKNKNEY
jgi:DNA-binding transcriptional MerR regulator